MSGRGPNYERNASARARKRARLQALREAGATKQAAGSGGMRSVVGAERYAELMEDRYAVLRLRNERDKARCRREIAAEEVYAAEDVGKVRAKNWATAVSGGAVSQAAVRVSLAKEKKNVAQVDQLKAQLAKAEKKLAEVQEPTAREARLKKLLAERTERLAIATRGMEAGYYDDDYY